MISDRYICNGDYGWIDSNFEPGRDNYDLEIEILDGSCSFEIIRECGNSKVRSEVDLNAKRK